MTGCSVDCTEVRFTSFLSSGFTTIAIVNPLDEKLVNAITVDWRGVGHTATFRHAADCELNLAKVQNYRYVMY